MKYKNNVLSIKLIDKSIQKIEGELFLNNEPPIIINEIIEVKSFLPLSNHPYSVHF